ncbi:MAG TPA: TatD family hydrolase [Candidatus Cloacimonadota bacterium]|nr:TatD family hydrolase [Candidatus Cloacimonadota bacterium]
MSLIDAHCHLANLAETHNVKLLIDEAKDMGINKFISCALTQRELDWQQRNPIPGVQWLAGIHPNFPECDLELGQIEAALKTGQLIAVGEIGLDRANPDLSSQLLNLETQLMLAAEFQRPAVLHIIGHQSQSYEILKRYPLRYQVYGYAGSIEGFQLLSNLNSWFTISSRILKDDKRDLLYAILRSRRFMFETDITQYYVKENEANPLLRLLAVFDKTLQCSNFSESELLDIQEESAHELFGALL